MARKLGEVLDIKAVDSYIKTDRSHGNSRGPGYLQACGIHQNPFHGERSRNHKHNMTKDSLLRTSKPVSKVPQIRTSCSSLQHKQNQTSRRANATPLSLEREPKGGSGRTSCNSRRGPHK
jgi:hypothetical protein